MGLWKKLEFLRVIKKKSCTFAHIYELSVKRNERQDL